MSAPTRRSVLAGMAGGVALPAMVPMGAACDERDPILDLIDRYIDARENYRSEIMVSDEESDAYNDNVLSPAEDTLMAARPVTQQGIVALLKLAIEKESIFLDGSGEKEPRCWFSDTLIENVYAALVEDRLGVVS